MMNYGYPSYYQPMMNAQQRIQQYEQANPQMFQQPAQQQAQTLSTIPVANIEEAKAYIVDLSGKPTLFYNASKNEIYLKRTNTQTGEADFIIFAKAEQPLSEVKEEKGINTYEKDFKALNDKIDGLYSLLQEKTEEEVATKGSKK